MSPRRPFLQVITVFLALAALGGASLGCHHETRAPGAAAPCRRDTEDDLKNAGATGVEGVKTGAYTAAETGKAIGSTTAGLVTGGTNEASKRWDEGKQNIKGTASDGAAKTKSQGSVPRCP